MAYQPLTPEEKRAIAQVAKERDFPGFIAKWLERELNELPYAKVDPTLNQGRCQVLMELKKLMESALTHTG